MANRTWVWIGVGGVAAVGLGYWVWKSRQVVVSPTVTDGTRVPANQDAPPPPPPPPPPANNRGPGGMDFSFQGGGGILNDPAGPPVYRDDVVRYGISGLGAQANAQNRDGFAEPVYREVAREANVPVGGQRVDIGR